MARVAPEPGLDEVQELKLDQINVLSLKDMDPDFNADGKVDAWEKDLYDRIKAADGNNDGYLTKSEVYNLLSMGAKETFEARAGGIAISSLNPDTDG